eukprot:c11496_g1_i1.p1 GENE.c11496_g1_i1~~c11496_g1_i1.p1  ORF type:complete len:111 (+),score=35.45 c11496_g1_i1:40-372(+)
MIMKLFVLLWVLFIGVAMSLKDQDLVLEKRVRQLENENLVLRQKLSMYENSDKFSSFLQTDQVPPMVAGKYGMGPRTLATAMGLPPAGMDCCPCLANEEDYRVYPQDGVA